MLEFSGKSDKTCSGICEFRPMLWYQESVTSAGSQELDNSEWVGDRHGAVWIVDCLCSSAHEKPKNETEMSQIKAQPGLCLLQFGVGLPGIIWGEYLFRCFGAFLVDFPWCGLHIYCQDIFKGAQLSEIYRTDSESRKFQWAGPCISDKFISMQCEGWWQGRQTVFT